MIFKLLTAVATKLANVERNGILKKGETTVELVREERALAQDHSIVDEYRKIVEILKPFTRGEEST